MIKDFLISFSENIKERSKNPFLGTYLLVWLIRNWDLVYSLFNFDQNSKRGERIKFVNDYYNKINFVENLLINILWSFGLLILTYILVNISRVIVNLSEKRLTPWIYKKTDSKSIVLKEEYDRIRSENDELQIRLDKERESKSKLETRIKNLENEILEISKINSNTTTETDIDQSSNNADKTDSFISRIRSKSTIEEFLRLCLNIQRGEPIENNDKSLNYFLQIGLIKFKTNYTSAAKYYALTADGEKVIEKLRLEM